MSQTITHEWEKTLLARLPLFGHRNWIVVADAAYPAHSGPGIETIYAGGDHVTVVEEVLRTIRASKHVQPVIYLDDELESLAEEDAPGITDYRCKIAELVNARTVRTMAHEDLVCEVDKVGTLFRMLVIKTDMNLPYTSVFVQLDCGYWEPKKERRLRDSMKKSQP